MINNDSIVTAYDEHLTLVEWLQKIEKLLANGGLKSTTLNDKGNATFSLTLTFNDNTTITSPDMTLTSVNEALTALNNAVAGIKDGRTHLFENITDKNGNKRFVDGNFPVENIEGITWTYHKWSLSGTHLMIVLAGRNNSGATITFAGNEIFGNLQDSTLSYIYDKIYILTANNLVSSAVLRTYQNYATAERGNLSLSKPSANHLRVINWNHGVSEIPDGSAFRVQFDLIIDDE